MENTEDKLFDLRELRTIAAGDNNFFIHMINLFISQNESAMQEISKNAATGNFAAIQSILHKMKPSIEVMGVKTVTEIIVHAEQLNMPEMDTPEFSSLLAKIENILKEVNTQLRLV
jgi:HPt (histidine-containing phosphotransfer) domain-containing protein